MTTRTDPTGRLVDHARSMVSASAIDESIGRSPVMYPPKVRPKYYNYNCCYYFDDEDDNSSLSDANDKHKMFHHKAASADGAKLVVRASRIHHQGGGVRKNVPVQRTRGGEVIAALLSPFLVRA